MEELHVNIALGLRAFELNLRVQVGRERLALVGPSGAGKSTVLRAIAGLTRPDRGRIALGTSAWFDREAKVNLAPEQRSVGLVFQEYALFPHLSVERNVAFGGNGDVAGLLARFGIAHLARERPAALSGGERQRVALARALARDPAVLLLDEPLSALDVQTRAIVRDELQELLAEPAVPTLLVTHDFREAGALADRIGVIVDGRLRQLGTPQELLERPADAFVARFAGANVLAGQATPRPGGGAMVVLADGNRLHLRENVNGPVDLAIYPWRLRLTDVRPETGEVIGGRVAHAGVEAGRLRVRLGALQIETESAARPRPGDELFALVDPADVIVLGPGATGA